MPKLRDSGVVIEYQPESDEDGAADADKYETIYYETGPSGETQLGESLKRQKMHNLSSLAFARFSAHYEDHGAGLKTQPPAGTNTKRLRYSREAHKALCHWKPKKADGPELFDRATQVALKGPSTNKQVHNISRESGTQTKAMSIAVEAPQEPPIQIPDYSEILDEILRLIKKVKKSCPGTHVPEGLVEDVKVSVGDLLKLLKTISHKEDALDDKASTIYQELVKRKDKPCPGPHIPDSIIHSIHQLLLDVEETLKNYKNNDLNDLMDFVKRRFQDLYDLIMEFRKDQSSILLAIENLNAKCHGHHVPPNWIQDSHALLMEILYILRQKKAEVTEYMEPEPQVNITTQCKCSDIAAKARINPKFSTQGFVPSLCQQCVNDYRGREFIKNLTLPVPRTLEVISLVGYLLQAIMDDDERRFDALMKVFKKHTPNWKPEEYQVFLEALLHLALIWDRQICAQHIVAIVNVPNMFIKITENRRIFNICDFLKSAAGAQNPEVLWTLLNGLTDKQKIIVINSPSIFQEQKILAIFEAARRGDVKCFEILAEQGAEFDMFEKGRTILHELVRLSGKKQCSSHSSEWEVTISKMMDCIYDNASRWWERHQGKSEYDKGSSAARISALQYLFWHCKEKKRGMTIVEYAGAYGSAYVMQKIMTNIPYHFLPDPFEAGYYTSDEGFVVDDVDSNTQEGLCVLDYIVRRSPEEAGPILKVEPFNSIIEDKWLQYKPFYFVMFIAYLLYMCIYTACAFERPPLSERTFDEMYSTTKDWARFVGEMICLVCLPLFLYGEIRLCGKKRFSTVFNWFSTFRILNVIFVILTIVVLILRCLRNENEDVIFSIAVLIGWFNATVFLGAWRNTGMLPIALHMAWFQDVIPRFIPLYGLILLATSTSTFIVFQWSNPTVSEYTNETYFYTPFTLFKMTFALEDADFVGNSREPAIGYILFIVHVILAIVLIFYLLLAMIADTYRRTHKVLDSNWVWVRANFVLYLEARLPATFYISYNRNQRKRIFKFMKKPKLKYVKKIQRRRNQNGRIVEVEQCAVLLGRDDPPIPNPAPLKPPPLDIAAVKAPAPRKSPLPAAPHTGDSVSRAEGAVIDMKDDIPTLRTTTYEVITDVQDASEPEDRLTPITYIHGKGNRVSTSNM